MVAGYVGALRNISSYRQAMEAFVLTTCRARRVDPCQQLVILVGIGSNVGQEIAAEVAGVDWVDKHVGEWVMLAHGRAEAQKRWRERRSDPPNWPFAVLRDHVLAVWLAPFDNLPVHLTVLWNEATWLHGDYWEVTAPERPPASMPCFVEIAGRWRLWIPVPVL